MRKHFRNAAIALSLLFIAPSVTAQTYPDRPIRLVIPFPPGGATDLLGRLIGNRASELLGQPIVVENRSGAGGGIGARAVAQSKPDGYTLLFTVPGPITIIPNVNKSIGYRTSDLAPILITFRSPFMVTVPSSAPHKSLDDLVAAGRSAGGKPLAFGSSGVGAQSHLVAEMLNVATGTSFMHVPYKGSVGTIQALLTGDVQWVLLSAADGRAYLDSGQLRPLSVTTQQRSRVVPDVPSLREAGIREIDLDLWFGYFLPVGVPDVIVKRLNAVFKQVLDEPAMTARLRELGGEVPKDENNPDLIRPMLEREAASFAAIANKIGLKVE